MFIDEVDIIVKAGKGGDGCMAFLREKYRPMGGPAGGDGGRGGSVVFQAHGGLRTLADFRGKKIIQAKNGAPGEGKNKFGKSAKNLLIRVPVGTIIRNIDTDEIIGDLTRNKQKVTVAEGGRGGRGNQHFATPTHRAPRKIEKGTPGEEKNIRLELRLLADVGLVGKPNAGKSTMIGAVSTVKPKVANYEFTTLMPSVGVVSTGEYSSFTMADIPGLIEFAHMGKGLGHQFLRHIQRTEIICHLVEIPMYPEPMDEKLQAMIDAYRVIRNELEQYSVKIADKPEIVCITKIDLLDDEKLSRFREEDLPDFIRKTNCPGPVHLISSVTHTGLDQVIFKLADMLKESEVEEIEPDRVPEYVDGEPPAEYSLRELSMENLDDAGKD